MSFDADAIASTLFRPDSDNEEFFDAEDNSSLERTSNAAQPAIENANRPTTTTEIAFERVTTSSPTVVKGSAVPADLLTKHEETITFKGQSYKWTLFCNGDKDLIQSYKEVFIQSLEKRTDIKSGDSLNFTFSDSGYELIINNGTTQKIEDEEAKKLSALAKEINENKPESKTAIEEKLKSFQTSLKSAPSETPPPVSTPAVDPVPATTNDEEPQPLPKKPDILEIIRKSDQNYHTGLSIEINDVYGSDNQYRFACPINELNDPVIQLPHQNKEFIQAQNKFHDSRIDKKNKITSIKDGKIESENGHLFFRKSLKSVSEIKPFTLEILKKANDAKIKCLELPLLTVDNTPKKTIKEEMQKAIQEYNNNLTSKKMITNIENVKITLTKKDFLETVEGATPKTYAKNSSKTLPQLTSEEKLAQQYKKEIIEIEKLVMLEVAPSNSQSASTFKDLEKLITKTKKPEIYINYEGSEDTNAIIEALVSSQIKTESIPKIYLYRKSIASGST